MYNRRHFTSLLISFVLLSFSLTHAIRIPDANLPVQFDESCFSRRMNLLVIKLKSLGLGSNKKKMYDAVLDVKSEIESNFNIKFDLDRCMKNMRRELSEKDYELSDHDFCKISKELHKRENKHIPTDQEIWDEDFSDKKKIINQDDIPSKLVFGVTLFLCGIFVMVIPLPGFSKWGTTLITSGAGICADEICKRRDENIKSRKDDEEKAIVKNRFRFT